MQMGRFFWCLFKLGLTAMWVVSVDMLWQANEGEHFIVVFVSCVYGVVS